MASKAKQRRQQGKALLQGRAKTLSACAAFFFVAVTTVFPLYLHPQKYINLTMHKAYMFWLLTGAATLALLFALCSFRLNAHFIGLNTTPMRRITAAEWALLGFLLLCLLSAIMSKHQDVAWLGIPEPGGRYEGFLTFLCYGLSFWIIGRFYKPRDSHMRLFAAGVCLVALIGVLQFMDLDMFHLFPFDHEDYVDANGLPLYGGLSIFFRTTLGNVDIVSAYTALVVLLFTAMYAGDCSRWRFLHLGAAMSGFALMLIAGADAGKVGVLGAMVLLTPYWLAERRRLARILVTLSSFCAVYALLEAYWQWRAALNRENPTARLMDAFHLERVSEQALWPFWLLAALLLAGGLALLYLRKDLRWPAKMSLLGAALLGLMLLGGLAGVELLGKRRSDQPENIVYQARELMHGNLGDTFGSNRGWVWKRSLEAVPKYPLLGVGPDAFYHALDESSQTEASQRFGTLFDKAHNNALQTAVTLGIPALLCSMVFVLALYGPALRKAFDNPLLLAAGAGGLSYLIQAFFGVDVPIATPLFWVLMGLMAAELNRIRAAASETAAVQTQNGIDEDASAPRKPAAAQGR